MHCHTGRGFAARGRNAIADPGRCTARDVGDQWRPRREGARPSVCWLRSHGARRFLPTLGSLLILFACLAIIVMPLMIVLMLAGVVTVPVAGQQPPPSFTFVALFLALASLAFSVKFMMVVPVAAAESAGPLDIIKRSWRMTSGNYWRLLGFLLLLLVAAIFLLAAAQFVGGIVAQLIAGKIAPFSLGALILALLLALASASATTLFAVMLARIYLQLTGAAAAQASVPSSGT